MAVSRPSMRMAARTRVKRPFAEQEEGSAGRAAIYVEDALILLSVAALFVLAVFCRTNLWGQVGLGVVLVVMIVVFIRRFRRVHRAFKGQD